MRKINFKVRNVGSEKYLSYVIDEELDFDEELLDYLDDNKISELIDIIYEEDDENDYFTYNITDRTTVGELLTDTVNAEMMLGIIRGVATGIVNMRDLGIPVSYVILNKNFTYVNPVTYDVKLICIPIESDISLNAEFKMFVKDLIFSAKYPDTEDCNYVAKIINMLNVDKFTIRGFAAQLTELMESAGMQVEEEFMDIGDSGVEVSKTVEVTENDTSLDDLPEFSDVSFADEDDGLDLYDEEPVAENNIFKDLDLDADEGSVSTVNMDAFDESNLEELEIDETFESEEETPSQTEEAEQPEEAEISIDETEEATEVSEPEPESIEEQLSFFTETEESEGMTESLTSEQAPEVKESNITEVAHTADGVTEIITNDEKEEKPVLIDTEDMDALIDEPPVVKNIRINRAKIIQKAVNETEESSIDENPTEQIVGVDSENLEEPETITTPVSATAEAQKEDTSSGSTVELTAGMNVVKDTEPETENTNPGVPKAMPYIVRVDTGERVMINKAVFKLGKANRGVDFSISGNGAISKVHAIIYQREDGCYIKDNKATNPTYVDGVKLEENQELKLKNDSTIVIGGEDFLFKLS